MQQRPPLRELPVELLLLIVSFVEEEDLPSLCQTSKLFHILSSISLYRTIDINYGHSLARNRLGPPDLQKPKILSHMMQNKTLSALVTEFRVEFRWCFSTYSSDGPKPSATCICDRLDILLGQILPALVNLQTLHFICRCSSPSPWGYIRTHHSYLKHMTTTNLKYFRFQCHCTPRTDTQWILFAPCMQSITTLRWESCHGEGETNQIQDGYESLPHLTRLMCINVQMSAFMISKGTLTHLICDDPSSQPHDLLAKNAASLVHLSIPSISSSMGNNTTPYRNLQHLGRFKLSTDGDVSQPIGVHPLLNKLNNYDRSPMTGSRHSMCSSTCLTLLQRNLRGPSTLICNTIIQMHV